MRNTKILLLVFFVFFWQIRSLLLNYAAKMMIAAVFVISAITPSLLQANMSAVLIQQELILKVNAADPREHAKAARLLI